MTTPDAGNPFVPAWLQGLPDAPKGAAAVFALDTPDAFTPEGIQHHPMRAWLNFSRAFFAGLPHGLRQAHQSRSRFVRAVR